MTAGGAQLVRMCEDKTGAKGVGARYPIELPHGHV